MLITVKGCIIKNMYVIRYTTPTSSWDVDFNGTICQTIKEARMQLKTRYSGFDCIIAVIIESFEDQSYNIGEILKDGKWNRSPYKMYNCLEDDSTRQLYLSKFKERQGVPTKLRSKESIERSRHAYSICYPPDIRIARKLAKLKVAAAE